MTNNLAGVTPLLLGGGEAQEDGSALASPPLEHSFVSYRF